MDLIGRRKEEHLDLCRREAQGGDERSSFRRYRLEYDALPEVSLDEVDLSVDLLGQRLSAPLMIGSMTGGTPWAGRINRNLARAAERVGIGMALGSQRAMIEDPETRATFAVRDHAPDLPLLIGNVGAVQLNYGVSGARVAEALSQVHADACYLHLNPLQEAVQPEGETDFAGLMDAWTKEIPRLGVPILAKEVGAGFSRKTLEKLSRMPFAGVEASGMGGTNWALVEAARSAEDSPRARLGQMLAEFGVPTTESVIEARTVRADWTVVASGGVRSGLDAAIALVLGADAVALTRPLLPPADRSEEAVEEALRELLYQLRVVCYLTGSRNINELRSVTVSRVESGPRSNP